MAVDKPRTKSNTKYPLPPDVPGLLNGNDVGAALNFMSEKQKDRKGRNRDMISIGKVRKMK